MKYSSHLLVKIYIIILTSTWGSCWQFFTSISDLTLFNSPKDLQHIHSEYYFGHCQSKKKIFYTHTHLDHMSVLGKTIVRGWIDVYRIPTCIVLRAMAHETDLIRSSAFAFQVCVPRITYCHSQERYKYFYFELYIPLDMIGGMDWELYFYGPPSKSW